jgi:GT2 family glycosyltransferase
MQIRVSIVCLIYKSVGWLRFVCDQLYKYTDLKDKEFYFVANDASEEVLTYLRDNNVPHYVWRNSPEQRREWYINNVYRAWNFGAQQARGDFIVFINSDMAFTPGWLENLWNAYAGSNCLTSRLVESGKLRSGPFGVENNFGRHFKAFRESEFQDFALSIKEKKIENGGLFMPLLIAKKDFDSVGGYPEGNAVPETDLFHPKIARKGEPCLSGDAVLMEKLCFRGIIHQTVFDSVVYHFQMGEMDDVGPMFRIVALFRQISGSLSYTSRTVRTIARNVLSRS